MTFIVIEVMSAVNFTTTIPEGGMIGRISGVHIFWNPASMEIPSEYSFVWVLLASVVLKASAAPAKAVSLISIGEAVMAEPPEPDVAQRLISISVLSSVSESYIDT